MPTYLVRMNKNDNFKKTTLNRCNYNDLFTVKNMSLLKSVILTWYLFFLLIKIFTLLDS